MGDHANNGDRAIQTMRRDRVARSGSTWVLLECILLIMDEQDSDLASLHGYDPIQGRESSKIPGVIEFWSA